MEAHTASGELSFNSIIDAEVPALNELIVPFVTPDPSNRFSVSFSVRALRVLVLVAALFQYACFC